MFPRILPLGGGSTPQSVVDSLALTAGTYRQSAPLNLLRQYSQSTAGNGSTLRAHRGFLKQVRPVLD